MIDWDILETIDDISLKYNWFTPESKKKDISLPTKISYILCYWTLEEFKYLFNNISYSLIEEWFNRVKKDTFALKVGKRELIERILFWNLKIESIKDIDFRKISLWMK